MSRIFSRSPYIIEIDETGQTSSRIELFIWNGSTEPSEPQYILSKNIPASNITQTLYNVSPYIREYISFISYTPNTSDAVEDMLITSYANVRIKRYATDDSGETELDSTRYYAFDGYGTYEQGYNPEIADHKILLDEGTYYYNESDGAGSIYMRLVDFQEHVKYTNLRDNTSIIVPFSVDSYGSYNRVHSSNISDGNKLEVFRGLNVLWTGYFRPQCEPKYTPIYIDYVNRFGAWSRMFMFKTSKKSFSVKSNEYNLLQTTLLNYNVKEGQRKQFNVNGQESIKVNSGWVREDFGSHIKELMVSERILLNGRPVKCVTTSLDIQTGLNDKNIAYSLDFDFNNDFINSVV